MGILQIVFVIWFIGWVVAIYPIYNALVINQMKQVAKKSGTPSKVELDNGDIVNAAVGATFFSLFWYIAVPFFISFAIRNQGKPRIEAEIIKVKDDYRHKQLVEKARKELESDSVVEAKAVERYTSQSALRRMSRDPLDYDR